MATPSNSPQATAAALAAAQSSIVAGGPPYAPLSAGLGSPPSKIPDIPISACFLALFLFLGIANISLFKKNKKNGHKFVFNGAMFGFCKVRICSAALRIAWSCYPKLTSLAIAANIFVYAGAIILYLVNFFFTQRLIRARHPSLGWSRPFTLFVPLLITIAVASVICVIVAVLQGFYTLDTSIKTKDHDIQLYVITAFTALAFLPIPTITATFLLLPRRTYLDRFGSGRFRTKVVLLFTSSALLTLGAGFRCATDWLPPVSILAPRPWYDSTACFYVFTFTVEALVLILYLAARVDKRFYIPDGASGPGSYSKDIDYTVEWPESLYKLNDPSTYSNAASGSKKEGYAHSFQSGVTADTYNTFATDDTYTNMFSNQKDGRHHHNRSSSLLSIDPKTGRYSIGHAPGAAPSSASRTSLATTVRAPESVYTKTMTSTMNGSAPGVESRARTMTMSSSIGAGVGEAVGGGSRTGTMTTLNEGAAGMGGGSRAGTMTTLNGANGSPPEGSLRTISMRGMGPEEFDRSGRRVVREGQDGLVPGGRREEVGGVQSTRAQMF